VTGEKRDLLPLKLYEGAKIVTVREFLILQCAPKARITSGGRFHRENCRLFR
jgi:hypothetical protein